MTDLMTFTNTDFGEIRGVNINGEVWLVARDVCDALGIVNSKNVTAGLPHEFRDVVRIADRIGRQQEMVIVNEPGFYYITFKSRKPNAVAFQMWVCGEVLPAIRKNGYFINKPKAEAVLEIMEELKVNPDFIKETALELKHQAQLQELAEQQAVKDKLKALHKRRSELSETSYLNEVARICNDDGKEYKKEIQDYQKWRNADAYRRAGAVRK